MLLKVGRNRPCPCGSGKKYKKCHGSFTAAPPPQAPVSKSFVKQMVQRHEAAERIRQNQQGFGRPVVSFRAFDRQMVAVGDTIYHSADWKTFPDFLAHYLKTVLGVEWGNAELKKPLTDRHPIMQWYDVVCRYQAETIKEKGKVATCAMTGVVACYFGTAYNLYLLKHNVELQQRLVQRLKNPEQFQGL
jgi:SEC-C motif